MCLFEIGISSLRNKEKGLGLSQFMKLIVCLDIQLLCVCVYVFAFGCKCLFKLSVLMFYAPVFIFTSGSSALLGRPRCGLSI